jgi:hypothetical protein
MFFKKFQKSKDEICPWPLCGDKEGEGDERENVTKKGLGWDVE